MQGEFRVALSVQPPHFSDEVGAELRAHGIAVEVAESCLDLLDLIADRGPFDAIIATEDPSMACMGPTAIQVLAMLRTAGRMTPFVLMDEARDPSLLHTVRRAGNAVLIRRPFAVGDLRRLIEELGRSPRDASFDASLLDRIASAVPQVAWVRAGRAWREEGLRSEGRALTLAQSQALVLLESG